MSKKKTVWFEVAEDETVEACLKRITEKGYKVTGKKEEPLFTEVNGEFVPFRQQIMFSCVVAVN